MDRRPDHQQYKMDSAEDESFPRAKKQVLGLVPFPDRRTIG
jgi:hypothetical protein